MNQSSIFNSSINKILELPNKLDYPNLVESLSTNYTKNFFEQDFFYPLEMESVNNLDKVQIEELIKFFILFGISDIKFLSDFIIKKNYEVCIKCSHDTLKNTDKKNHNKASLQYILQIENVDKKVLEYDYLHKTKNELITQMKSKSIPIQSKKTKQKEEPKKIKEISPPLQKVLFWPPHLRKDIKKEVEQKFEIRFQIIDNDQTIQNNQKWEELKKSLKEISFQSFWPRYEVNKKNNSCINFQSLPEKTRQGIEELCQYFYDIGNALILSPILNNFIGKCIVCHKKPMEEEIRREGIYYQNILKKIKPEVQNELKNDINFIKNMKK